jgi:hypothetical protein
MINSTVSILASELLKNTTTTENHHNAIGTKIYRLLLQFISKYLDDVGAANEWNLRYVALGSCIVLGIIRFLFPTKKYYSVDWCSLIHAIITGGGALICIYLDMYTAHTMTTTTATTNVAADVALNNNGATIWNIITSSETYYRTIVTTCSSPLTSLHRILPAITVGYSLLDFIHGLTLGIDFLFHGAITMLATGYMIEMNMPHLMSSFLIMECSTIFLTLIRAEFFNETLLMINMAFFVLSFFIARCVIVPYLWFHLMIVLADQYQMYHYEQCFHRSFMDIIFVFGLMFHCLNGFWMFKIIQKVLRKLRRTEDVTSGNDIGAATKGTQQQPDQQQGTINMDKSDKEKKDE